MRMDEKMRELEKVKILAMYLPQYHEVEENSKFWGKGFTDWVSVKTANPLYNGHQQPEVPLNANYYDLSQKESIAWQISLAKKYSVYGFGIYHYWFSNEKMLLTKPAEIILQNKDLDIPFFFAWDNASWRRTWSKFRGNAWAPMEDSNNREKKKGPSILIKYELGTRNDWKIHFEYLLEYFRDERYIKVDGKPIFEIFNYSDEIYKMHQYWNELAKVYGFNGIEIVYKKSALYKLPEDCVNFCYEPQNSGWGAGWKLWTFKALSMLGLAGENGPLKYSYDKVWNSILKNAKNRSQSNEWHGAFVCYDDTPRRGKQGRVVTGATPEKFEKYLHNLLKLSSNQGKDYILLSAWNEWGEGAMLEPSEKDGYRYLEALKVAVENQ